jgi:hypothetical protein
MQKYEALEIFESLQGILGAVARGHPVESDLVAVSRHVPPVRQDERYAAFTSDALRTLKEAAVQAEQESIAAFATEMSDYRIITSIVSDVNYSPSHPRHWVLHEVERIDLHPNGRYIATSRPYTYEGRTCVDTVMSGEEGPGYGAASALRARLLQALALS